MADTAEGGTASADVQGTGSGEGTPQQKPAASFSQEQVDAIIADRLKRESQKYSDYEDLKAKAAKVDAAEEASKSELQKANEAKAAAENAAREASARGNTALKRASIMVEAATQGSVDPETVVALLINSGDVKVDEDGNAIGAADAVKKLLESKPYLKSGATRASGGDFGGGAQTTSIDDEIRKAEKEGRTQDAIALKMRKALGQS